METKVMKKTKVLLTALFLISLTACQKKYEDKNAGIKVSQANQMSSDELTSAAEQLITPYSFMVAHKMAKLALEKNPTNAKAEFIYLLTKRFEAFRGLHTRMRPLLKGVQIQRHEEWAQRFPNSPLKTFLTAPGAPLKNLSDTQDVLSDYFAAIEEFRNFLKKKQAHQIEIQLNANAFEGEIREEMADRCRYKGTEDDAELICDFSEIAVKKLNSADFIALRQILAGEMLYSMFNNYSLSGIDRIDENRTLTNQQKTKLMSEISELGKLRNRHTFAILKDIGSDLSGAIKWALRYQKELCPKGAGTANQRRGFVFSSGICVDDQDEAQKLISVLDNALRGAIRVDLKDANHNTVSTMVSPFVWSKNPIKDLRSIAPTQWNECDEATSLVDNSLGGLFVEKNYHLFMDKKCGAKK